MIKAIIKYYWYMKESNIKLMVYETVNNISLLEILVYIFFI